MCSESFIEELKQRRKQQNTELFVQQINDAKWNLEMTEAVDKWRFWTSQLSINSCLAYRYKQLFSNSCSADP